MLVAQRLFRRKRTNLHEKYDYPLKQAADEGWSDIEAGRYTDVDDDQLEDYVARLGELEASAKYPAPDASTKGIPSEPLKGIPATVAVPATVGTLIGSPRRRHDYTS